MNKILCQLYLNTKGQGNPLNLLTVNDKDLEEEGEV